MEINVEEFISVKGFKALGNQLTDKKLKVVSLKEALPYEEIIEDVITEIEVEAEDVGPKNSATSDDEETQFTIDF
jgi:topoisomerase-4 subunit A